MKKLIRTSYTTRFINNRTKREFELNIWYNKTSTGKYYSGQLIYMDTLVCKDIYIGFSKKGFEEIARTIIEDIRELYCPIETYEGNLI